MMLRFWKSTFSPRGTRFLITVPAFLFLWSAHDEFLEHKLQYTLTQTREVGAERSFENEACNLPLRVSVPDSGNAFGLHRTLSGGGARAFSDVCLVAVCYLRQLQKTFFILLSTSAS